MKKFVSFLLLTSLLFTLAACASDGDGSDNDTTVSDVTGDITKSEENKTGISVSSVSAAISAALENAAEMTSVPETYINSMLEVNTENLAEFEAYKQMTGAVIDEYGIFKVKSSEYIDATVAALYNYIEVSKTSPNVLDYMPEEMPKLDAAEVRVMGDFVVFCILSEEAKADFFSAVSSVITE